MAELKDFGEILFEFPVLYAGWECDEKGYVVRGEDSSILLVTSNHGRWSVALPGEIEDKIAEYGAAILASQKALAMLESRDPDADWWRESASEICEFHMPGDRGAVLTLNGRELSKGQWEYAIVHWFYKSPSLYLLWRGAGVSRTNPDIFVTMPAVSSL